MAEKTARREFVLAGLCGLAGAIGGIAGRAMASAADEPSWQYAVRCQTPDGIEGLGPPTEDINEAARACLRAREVGYIARVERRAVGPWERYEPAEQAAAELSR